MSTATAGEASAPYVIHGVQGLRQRVGTDLGVSDWATIQQD
jgi:hypothetical protein